MNAQFVNKVYTYESVEVHPIRFFRNPYIPQIVECTCVNDIPKNAELIFNTEKEAMESAKENASIKNQKILSALLNMRS